MNDRTEVSGTSRDSFTVKVSISYHFRPRGTYQNLSFAVYELSWCYSVVRWSEDLTYL